jgi:hypothetical protein
MQVVPCSNGAHNLEAYAVGHGGWGHGPVPVYAHAFSLARSVCVPSFQQRFGHAIGAGRTGAWGWYGFWPDRGAEQAKYGDRIVCSLRRFPAFPAMGRGVHF